MTALRSHLRELRTRAGVQQQELAARVGVSRQSLSAIETGATIPSTALALELARALSCSVEDLFVLAAADAPLLATVATPATPMPSGRRVRLGFIRGAWVAHPLDDDSATPADGIVVRASRGGRVAIRPLRDLEALRANLLVAGCDPALGLLGGHLLDGPARLRLHWIEAASEPALAALDRGLVHAAGIHIFDAASGEYNVPAIRARFAGRHIMVINLASWQQGLVVRRGDARRIRGAADLAATDVRVALREPGSGARALLERVLAAEGLALSRLRTTEPQRGHFAVARSVAQKNADVGIATAAAAASFGLSFVPLADDRFDLVMLAETAESVGGTRALETLSGARFRHEIAALPGYGTARTGRIIARLTA